MAKWLNIILPPVWLYGNLTSFFLAELIFTFALVSTVLHTAVNRQTAGNSYYGIAIGAIVATWVVVVGKISGGVFNPAVLLGVGLFGIPLKSAWVILLGQWAGWIGAAWVYRYIVGK
jgi:aquaporin Z